MISTAVVSFDFNSHPVRVVMQDGEPWFVATDVAEALGYRNAPDATRHLGEHQKGSTQIARSTSGGNPTATIINESGLYRLVLRSRKPEAVAFSDWVTGEVLPSIRKTGGYAQAPQQAALPLPEPQIMIPAPALDLDAAQSTLTSAWATGFLIGREMLTAMYGAPTATHFLVEISTDKTPTVRALVDTKGDLSTTATASRQWS